MTGYCLDTDVISAVLKPAPPLHLIRRLAVTPPECQFITAITVGELVYGAARRRNARPVLESVAQQHQADVVLVDVGPSLGAINRAALIASDHVVVPVAPDLFSLQGLRNLGPTLRRWRGRWQEMLEKLEDRSRRLPAGVMAPLGYIVLGHGVRLNRPAQAYQRWIARISTMPC